MRPVQPVRTVEMNFAVLFPVSFDFRLFQAAADLRGRVAQRQAESLGARQEPIPRVWVVCRAQEPALVSAVAPVMIRLQPVFCPLLASRPVSVQQRLWHPAA
jgi:hypothetical protein